MMKTYTLDQNAGAKPLYGQVHDILYQKIVNQEYAPGDFIPTEKELEKMFGVSRMTIRLAVDSLVRDGLVVKERPKGTRVLGPRIVEKLNQVTSFHQEMERNNVDYRVKSSRIKLVSTNDWMAKHLQVPMHTKVYELHRVCEISRIPFLSMTSFLPESVDLSMNDERYKGSLYAILEQKGIHIQKVDEQISIAYADEQLASELGLDLDAPVLKRVRTSFDQTGQIIEYVVVFYRPDKYVYSVSYGE